MELAANSRRAHMKAVRLLEYGGELVFDDFSDTLQK
jgi:hypothetical protein